MDKIIFTHKAVISIKREIAKYPNIETGGALLGYLDKSNAYYVTTIIDGGPKAIRDTYNFKCDLDYTNMMIDKLIANSPSNLEYLGEWHSHPQIEPQPSDVDLNSLYNMTTSFEKEILMVIFGFIDFHIENIENQSLGIVYDIGDKTFYSLPLLFE